MTIAAVLLSQLVPFLLGYTTVAWVFRGRTLPFLPRLALSFLLGTGLFSSWILLAGFVGAGLSVGMLAGVPFLLSVALWGFLLRTRERHNSVFQNPETSSGGARGMLWWILMAFVAWNVLQAVWASSTIPLVSWDALSTNVFKAKVLFYEQAFTFNSRLPHPEYPLFIPLLEFWVNAFYGVWSDQLVKGLFPLFYVSFLTVQYFFLRQYVGRTWAAAAAALTVCANLFSYHAAIAYRDLPLATMNCCAVFTLLLWRKERFGGWLIAASIFSGLTALTKSEGIVYVLIHLSLFLAMLTADASQKHFSVKNVVRFFLPAGVLVGMLQLYRMSLGLKARLALGSFDFWRGLAAVPVDYWARMTNVAWLMFFDLFFSTSWGMNWILLCLAVMLPRPGKWSASARWLAGVVAGSLLAVWIGFSFSPFYKDVIHAVEPQSRILLHIFPLVPALTVLLLAPGRKSAAIAARQDYSSPDTE